MKYIRYFNITFLIELPFIKLILFTVEKYDRIKLFDCLKGFSKIICYENNNILQKNKIVLQAP